MVCLGNICRSPTAEAVLKSLVEAEGLGDEIEVDSAGTGAYHVGEPPDRRSAAAAARRGVRLAGRARQFERSDWADFDYVLAVDESTRDILRRGCPAGSESKLNLLRSFDRGSPANASVPDPYHGGEPGFEHVLDLCEVACKGLLAEIKRDRLTRS
jgi:protein-tyrosine phosphatase